MPKIKEQKRRRLSPILTKYRKKLFYKLWQEVKGDLAMSELAEVLNDFPLDQFYKIIKDQEKHEKSKT